MLVFISHAFSDDARFDDLCHAFEKEKVSYWNPKEMRGGASLREQLRQAIARCDLCVFLATQKSVESSWCNAELGAFWGAGKKVIIYVADDNLTDDMIPEQFKGDIWYRKIRDVVSEARRTLQESTEKRKDQQQHTTLPTRVADISIGTLVNLLRTVLNERSNIPPFSDTMSAIKEVLSSKKGSRNVASDADLAAQLTPLLQRLIGEPLEVLKSYGRGHWGQVFSLQTNTGHWQGYSHEFMFAAGGDVTVFQGCLLLRANATAIDACIVFSSITEVSPPMSGAASTQYQFAPAIAAVGESDIGSITGFGEFVIKGN